MNQIPPLVEGFDDRLLEHLPQTVFSYLYVGHRCSLRVKEVYLSTGGAEMSARMSEKSLTSSESSVILPVMLRGDANTKSERRRWVGEGLRMLRMERGLSQTDLAERCSSRSSLAAYETGQSEPQVTVLLEILDALGSDLAEFSEVLERVRVRSGNGSPSRLPVPAASQDAQRRRRAFLLVDVSEEVPGEIPTEADELDRMLDRLTSFAYRHGAAVRAEHRRAERERQVPEEQDAGERETASRA